MDNYLIEKYKIEFQDKKIKIDKYMKKKLGLQLKNTFIKIDQLYIYCVPFELSLSGCKVIIVMKEDEFRIFKEDNGQKSRLYLKFENDSISDRKVSFFIWAAFSGAEPYNESLNMWLVKLDYISVPLIYNESLIKIFLKNEKYELSYKENSENEKYYGREALKNKNIQEYAVINQKKYLVVKLSVGRLYMITEKSTDHFADNNISVGFMQTGESSPLYVTGEIIKYHNIKGISEKLIAEIKLYFSPYLVEILD